MSNRRRMTFGERMARNTRRDGDCIIWTGAHVPRGYGTLKFHGKWEYAHRLAWQERNGPIPTGHFVCHKCDRPACVNPDHLFIGTHAENMEDMKAKGRQRLGTKNRAAKLSEADVLAIRSSVLSTTALSAKYGVTPSVLSKARNGLTWRHVAR